MAITALIRHLAVKLKLDSNAIITGRYILLKYLIREPRFVSYVVVKFSDVFDDLRFIFNFRRNKTMDCIVTLV